MEVECLDEEKRNSLGERKVLSFIHESISIDPYILLAENVVLPRSVLKQEGKRHLLEQEKKKKISQDGKWKGREKNCSNNEKADMRRATPKAMPRHKPINPLVASGANLKTPPQGSFPKRKSGLQPTRWQWIQRILVA